MPVMYVMAFGPRCFRCLMQTPSGPTELFKLLFLIAFIVSSGVMVMCVGVSLVMLWSVTLFVLRVVCFTAFINCLLKCLAVSDGEVLILLLNLMDRCDIVFNVLPDIDLIVAQSFCVLFLWSTCCSMYM